MDIHDSSSHRYSLLGKPYGDIQDILHLWELNLWALRMEDSAWLTINNIGVGVSCSDRVLAASKGLFAGKSPVLGLLKCIHTLGEASGPSCSTSSIQVHRSSSMSPILLLLGQFR